jgi:hypothetical protein
LAETGSDSWRRWHEDFSIKGDSSDKSERKGRLLLLAPNAKDVFAQIELFNLGIVALHPQPSDGAAHYQAEL